MNIPINVWYYNELLNDWMLKTTPDFKETKDEYKYFRVISNGNKYFYSSSKDYILHNKNNIDLVEDVYSINNELIHEIISS